MHVVTVLAVPGCVICRQGAPAAPMKVLTSLFLAAVRCSHPVIETVEEVRANSGGC